MALLLAAALSAPSFASGLDAPSIDANPPSRWDRAGWQGAAGVGGAFLGAAAGGLSGGLVGLATSSMGGKCADDDLGCAYKGFAFVAVGAAAGGLFGTAYGVQKAAPEPSPSRGIVPALVGAALGATASGLMVDRMSESVPSYDPGVLNAGLPILLSTVAGSVLVDRAFARSTSVSLVPWSPRPGQVGARLSLVW